MTETKTWLDDDNNVVEPEKATQLVVTRYDDKGELISEHFFNITKEEPSDA